ncbi:MAG: collagen-like protein [Bacteroidetes bacterium]|nr:collagen-like protein [Bacteroidota bacterium]
MKKHILIKLASLTAFIILTANFTFAQNDYISTLTGKNLVIKTNDTARMIITTGGYVGIGTANPKQKLSVNGSASIADSLYLSKKMLGTSDSILLMENNIVKYKLLSPITGPTGPTGAQGEAGLTGATGIMGATGANGETGNTGATGATGFLGSGAVSGNTPYWNGSQWILNSSNIYNDGVNVGIGKSNPTEKVDINGNLKISGTTTTTSLSSTTGTFNTIETGSVYTNTFSATTMSSKNVYADSVMYLQSNYMPGGNPRHTVINANNAGNLGVGTTTPKQKLQVNGSVSIYSPTTAGSSSTERASLFFGLEQSTLNSAAAERGEWGIQYLGGDNNSSGVGGLNFWKPNGSTGTTGDNLLFLQDNGNVGIGTANATEKLTVGGNLSVIGNIKGDHFQTRTIESDTITVDRIMAKDSIIKLGNHSIWVYQNNNRLIGKIIKTFNVNGVPYCTINTSGICIGENTFATGPNSFAAGSLVKANADNSIIIGNGVDNYFQNSISHSLMVGFNSDIPTLTVRAASGVGTIGKVGIGTTDPEQSLQVDKGNILVRGTNNYGSPGDEAAMYFGDVNHYIKSINGSGLRIGTFGAVDAISIQQSSGNVGIGTTNPGNYKLAVEGSVAARSFKVTLGNFYDYVFEKDYQLITLDSVETFITKNKHLPDIPCQKEVITNGLDIGEFNSLLLKKIEELTLYIIDQNKRIETLENKIK